MGVGGGKGWVVDERGVGDRDGQVGEGGVHLYGQMGEGYT